MVARLHRSPSRTVTAGRQSAESWSINKDSCDRLTTRSCSGGLRIWNDRPYAWFPALRLRSSVSVSVTVSVIRVRTAVPFPYRDANGYGKIELGPILKDERKRQTSGNRERYFYVSFIRLRNSYGIRINVILAYF